MLLMLKLICLEPVAIERKINAHKNLTQRSKDYVGHTQ